jgi:hypothetical protein
VTKREKSDLDDTRYEKIYPPKVTEREKPTPAEAPMVLKLTVDELRHFEAATVLLEAHLVSGRGPILGRNGFILGPLTLGTASRIKAMTERKTLPVMPAVQPKW